MLLRAGFLLVEFSWSIQLGERPITIRKRTITVDDIDPIHPVRKSAQNNVG